jgi:hypothetical protein
VFDTAPGHLFQLMDPGVAVIGVDQLDANLGSFFGTAYISCVDDRSAPGRAPPKHARVFHYFGPTGSAPVPALSYREGPFGVGPVVFEYFMVPRGTTVTLRSLKLQSRSGALKNPPYVRLTGGVRDWAGRPSGARGGAGTGTELHRPPCDPPAREAGAQREGVNSEERSVGSAAHLTIKRQLRQRVCASRNTD